MIEAYLSVCRSAARLRVWVYDSCMTERVLFEALVKRPPARVCASASPSSSPARDRMWGVRITLQSCGGDQRVLAWWLYRGTRERGWALQGPLRRLA